VDCLKSIYSLLHQFAKPTTLMSVIWYCWYGC